MMLAYLAANGVVDHKYLFPVGGDLQGDGGVQTKMGRSINSPRDFYHRYTRDLKRGSIYRAKQVEWFSTGAIFRCDYQDRRPDRASCAVVVVSLIGVCV